MLGQGPDAEAGKQPEGQVKACYQRLRDKPAKPARGNGKLREDPPGLIGGARSQAFRESSDFLCREAVKKEMRDDQVVARSTR